jgi:hypothetical protein
MVGVVVNAVVAQVHFHARAIYCTVSPVFFAGWVQGVLVSLYIMHLISCSMRIDEMIVFRLM